MAVLLAGLTSLINLYEAPIATVQEKLHLGRVQACAVIAVIGAVISVVIQGIVSDWMDVLSIYICPLGAGLAGIMFFWLCGKDYVEEQINKGREKPFTKWFVPVCKYLYIPVCFFSADSGNRTGRNRVMQFTFIKSIKIDTCVKARFRR